MVVYKPMGEVTTDMSNIYTAYGTKSSHCFKVGINTSDGEKLYLLKRCYNFLF